MGELDEDSEDNSSLRKKDSLCIIVSFDSGVFIIEARVSMARAWQAWTPMIDIYPFLFSTPLCTTALLWSKLLCCMSPFRLYRPSSIYAHRVHRHTGTQTLLRGFRVLVFELVHRHRRHRSIRLLWKLKIKALLHPRVDGFNRPPFYSFDGREASPSLVNYFFQLLVACTIQDADRLCCSRGYSFFLRDTRS